jgi:hypothetical protein
MNGKTAKALRREALLYAKQDDNTALRLRTLRHPQKVMRIPRPDLDPMTGLPLYIDIPYHPETVKIVGGVRFYNQRLKAGYRRGIVGLKSRRIQGRAATESLLTVLVPLR